MIGIVDYEMGNLRSVSKAFERLGHACRIVQHAEEIAAVDKLVLPGVGAFHDAMNCLAERGMDAAIREFIRTGGPFFGICLGLQLLFEKSFEDGEHRGLGILPGKVVRFELPRPLKVPHMGWNQLEAVRLPDWLGPLPTPAWTYFVHSYHVIPVDPSCIAIESDYGGKFVAAVWADNVFATQFHPEKSQQAGLAMLDRFGKA